MNEEKPQHHLPRRVFLIRLSHNILLGSIVISFSLVLGMTGYHHFENMAWVDAFENAAMILSGMGPVSSLQTSAGKIFAGLYALFSGVIFLVIIGIIFVPVVHRFFLKFHLEETKTK